MPGCAATSRSSIIVSIYRHKLAGQPVELPIWETFEARLDNIIAAKREVLLIRDYVLSQSRGRIALDSTRDLMVLAHDAATLDRAIAPESVDYIFTDPPYGDYISYLDLSILWNHWLGFHVPDDARANETIVGGEKALSEDHYRQSLSRSIRTCTRLLRKDRWISIVFQHWDVSYFETILDTARDCGAELKAAITQTGDVIWSMHKKKNAQNLLAGEMILTFHLSRFRAPKRRRANDQGTTRTQDNSTLLGQVLDGLLADKAERFSSESLFNRLVIQLWHRDALGCLCLGRDEFLAELHRRGWQYDRASHLWSMPNGGESSGNESLLFDAEAV